MQALGSYTYLVLKLCIGTALFLPLSGVQRLVAFGKTKLFISTPRTLFMLERERKRLLPKVVSYIGDMPPFILPLQPLLTTHLRQCSLSTAFRPSLTSHTPHSSLVSSHLTKLLYYSSSYHSTFLTHIIPSPSSSPSSSSSPPPPPPTPTQGADPTASVERCLCAAVAKEDKGCHSYCPQVQVRCGRGSWLRL